MRRIFALASGGARVVDHFAERPIVEVVELAVRRPLAQQALRRQHDERERFDACACARSKWKYCEAVEQIRDPDVAFGRELQEALEPRAGVFGSRAFIAVRQQQRQA